MVLKVCFVASWFGKLGKRKTRFGINTQKDRISKFSKTGWNQFYNMEQISRKLKWTKYSGIWFVLFSLMFNVLIQLHSELITIRLVVKSTLLAPVKQATQTGAAKCTLVYIWQFFTLG